MLYPERSVLVKRGDPRLLRDELWAGCIGCGLHKGDDSLLCYAVVPRRQWIGALGPSGCSQEWDQKNGKRRDSRQHRATGEPQATNLASHAQNLRLPSMWRKPTKLLATCRPGTSAPIPVLGGRRPLHIERQSTASAALAEAGLKHKPIVTGGGRPKDERFKWTTQVLKAAIVRSERRARVIGVVFRD